MYPTLKTAHLKSARRSENKYVLKSAALCLIPPESCAGYFFSVPKRPNSSKYGATFCLASFFLHAADHKRKRYVILHRTVWKKQILL